MGIRFFAQRGGDAASLRVVAPTVVATANDARLEVRSEGRVDVVDRASLLVLPVGITATLSSKSPIVHVLALTSSPALASKVVATYEGEIDPRTLADALARVQSLPRTNWVNELLHRYLFERAVCRKRDNDATRFLETELLKEVYFLSRAQAESSERASVVEGRTPLVARTLKEIEAHLFERDVLERLPRACHASESTILRAFKREVGRTPNAYVRERRLDEADLLLKSRRFTVSEVAAKVGYAQQAAFAAAFRARFGRRPSDVRVTSRRGR